MLYSKYHKDYYTKDVEATEKPPEAAIEQVDEEIEKPKAAPKKRRRRASKKSSDTTES